MTTTTKKATTRKAPAKKAPAKKATVKKTRAKKAPPKTLFERLESGPVGTPIRIANRTFLASLGLFSTIQTEFGKFQTDFEKRFDRLVKDGEKARNRYRKQFMDFRKGVAEEIDETIEDVTEDVTEFKDRVVERVSATAK